jgi:uncharacterized protein YheU (UPF0270 family)
MEDTERENAAPPMEIPYEKLSPEALEGVIDDFILREGTDYGASEVGHESKRAQVLRQLQKEKIKLVYEPGSESITLLTLDEWRRTQCAST